MSYTTCGHPACNADPDHPFRAQNRDLLAALEAAFTNIGEALIDESDGTISTETFRDRLCAIQEEARVAVANAKGETK